MLLHDTSSNQLVETAILSMDFSQLAILQSALHPRSQPARSSDRSPSTKSLSFMLPRPLTAHSMEVMVYQYDKLLDMVVGSNIMVPQNYTTI